MRKLFFLLALTSTFAFVSCSDDDGDTTQENFVRAKIDGADFEAASVTFFVDNGFGEDIVFINGTEGTDEIGINIPVSSPVGTTVAIDENDISLVFTDASQAGFFTVGEMTLSTLDTSGRIVAGTFSFTANDGAGTMKEITEGSFYVAY